MVTQLTNGRFKVPFPVVSLQSFNFFHQIEIDYYCYYIFQVPAPSVYGQESSFFLFFTAV